MHKRSTVVITGSSGLVGSGLVSYFSRAGFMVRAFQRVLPKVGVPGVEYYPFDLQDVQDREFAGADYLVHCAYRPVISERERETGKNADVEGGKRIIEFSRKHGVKMIFLSSLSAHVDALSYYGKNKLEVERLFDPGRDLILRLGIVIGGRGGLFGRITTALRTHKIIPLIGAGTQRAQIIGLEDLSHIVEVGIDRAVTGTYAIAHPAIITMKELYKGIARAVGAKPMYVPVPLSFAYALTLFAERIGLHLPFTSQSILGLKDLRTTQTGKDIGVFGITIADCQTTLSRLHFNP